MSGRLCGLQRLQSYQHYPARLAGTDVARVYAVLAVVGPPCVSGTVSVPIGPRLSRLADLRYSAVRHWTFRTRVFLQE